MEVPPEDTSRYGVIDSKPSEDPLDHGRLHKVTRLVEKPAPGDAPSNLAIIGRYVLTPKIFDKLEQTQRGAGGEIQLTDAIQTLMEEQAGLRLRVRRHPLRRRHDDGLAQGVGRDRPHAARPRHRVPRLPPGAPALTRPDARLVGYDAAHDDAGRGAAPRDTRGRFGRDRTGPGRSLPPDRAAGQRRDGDHLPRHRYQARSRRRAQAPSSRVPARSRLLVAFPPGGPGGRLAQPPERRHRLRLRRGPERPVHRHGAGRRRGPRRRSCAGAARSRRARPPGSGPASRGPSPRPMPAGSSTATSSPATS